MKLQSPITILRIFDEAKAKEFYIHYMGFNKDWEYRLEENMPLYMQISKDDCIIHLSEHHGDGTPGTKILVEIDDVKAYQTELKSKKYKSLNPGIEKTEWAEQEMHIIDPFGNILIFFRPIKK